MSERLGPLVGRGRTADVYDVGGGRVLRRYRIRPAAGAVEREVAVMNHLCAHGFPTPAVHDVEADGLVMGRLDGVTMLDLLRSRPRRLRRFADIWARLHLDLAAVPVGGLAAVLPTAFGAPHAIIHLDFHPGNIMMTAAGPVVFDWTNAALGPLAADVAQSWIVSATSVVDGPWFGRLGVTAVRARLIDRFVDQCGREAAVGLLAVVGTARLLDPNVRPHEAEKIRALIASRSGPDGHRSRSVSR